MADHDSKNRRLSKEEIFVLAQKSTQGDLRAREQLILSQLPLVDQLINEFSNRGVDREDLYQDGCYGLIKAIDRFDPNRGVQLSTYAAYWIRKYLKKALIEQNQYSPIIHKEAAFYAVQRYNTSLLSLRDELGRSPTDEELASRMNCGVKAILRIRSHCYSFCSMDSGRAQEYMDESFTPPLILPLDKLSPSAENEALKSLGEFSDYDVQLSEIEELTLRRYLGFTPTGEPEDLKDISASTGLSIDALRRSYYRALKKIRTHAFLHQ